MDCVLTSWIVWANGLRGEFGVLRCFDWYAFKYSFQADMTCHVIHSKAISSKIIQSLPSAARINLCTTKTGRHGSRSKSLLYSLYLSAHPKLAFRTDQTEGCPYQKIPLRVVLKNGIYMTFIQKKKNSQKLSSKTRQKVWFLLVFVRHIVTFSAKPRLVRGFAPALRFPLWWAAFGNDAMSSLQIPSQSDLQPSGDTDVLYGQREATNYRMVRMVMSNYSLMGGYIH